jgi:hypothetical protein
VTFRGRNWRIVLATSPNMRFHATASLCLATYEPPGEGLRLLEKPEGTIPIHRVLPIPDKKSLEDLIVALRGGS